MHTDSLTRTINGEGMVALWLVHLPTDQGIEFQPWLGILWCSWSRHSLSTQVYKCGLATLMVRVWGGGGEGVKL